MAVLVLTMHEDDDSVLAAMRAGARGYLVKGAEQEEIARAIRAVAAGEADLRPGRGGPDLEPGGPRDPAPTGRSPS